MDRCKNVCLYLFIRVENGKDNSLLSWNQTLEMQKVDATNTATRVFQVSSMKFHA